MWTDGACAGNPGPGGWAALLRVRRTLAPPPPGISDVARHYREEIEKLRARGLLVTTGDAGPSRARARVPIADCGQPVRVWVERELSGSEPQTTNNRMEIMALLEGLRALKRPTRVKVTTDSRYVMNAFERRWLATWQRNGWRTSAKQPVANKDLWERLLIEYARHEVTFAWVQGHAGVTHNERVDKLAVAARDRATPRDRAAFATAQRSRPHSVRDRAAATAPRAQPSSTDLAS